MSEVSGALQNLLQKTAQPASKEPEEEKSPDMTDKIVWQPAKAAEDYDIRLQDGSVRPMSESALRAQILELKKAGLIDSRHALKMLDIPDADEIADDLQREMELAALAKVKR
jgi:hypothetical protein